MRRTFLTVPTYLSTSSSCSALVRVKNASSNGMVAARCASRSSGATKLSRRTTLPSTRAPPPHAADRFRPDPYSGSIASEDRFGALPFRGAEHLIEAVTHAPD